MRTFCSAWPTISEGILDHQHADKVKARYIAPIREDELACRIIEAIMDPPAPRPEGLTAAQALAVLDADIRNMGRAAAKAAMGYWAECIAAANSTN